MSSHVKAGGSSRIEEDPVEAANHYFGYLDEHQLRVQGGGSGTNHDTTLTLAPALAPPPRSAMMMS